MNPNQATSGASSLDPDVKNLAIAIRQTESGGDFKAQGKSGEYGAYQFTEPTWKSYTQKHLGKQIPLKESTPEQQNEVAYKQLKEWKDKGLNVGQIASMWNAGEGEPDAYTGKFSNGAPSTGVNKYKVKFDVPAYAKSVATAYQKIKGGQSVGTDTENPSSTSYGQPSADSQGYITKTAIQQDTEKPIDKAEPEGLMGKLRGRMEYAGQGLTDAATGKINPLSGISHVAGALGGAVGDVSNSALNTATFGLSGKAEGFIGRQVGKLANTGVGQSVIGTAQGFAEAHPELAADLGDVGNVITALPILKGAQIAKNAVGRTISKTLGKDALSGVMADVAPAVSAKGVAQEAGKGGLMQTLISGRVKTVASKEARDIAEEVVKAVPNFEKLGTYTAKLNATREAVYSLADDLKSQIIQSGKNIIYPFKELKAAFDVLKNDRDLISVFSDKTMANAYDRFTKAAMEISKENGGTISSLFDARKGFDDLVRRAYPNLYKSSQLTPMRIAVRKIRGTMNNFIEKKLPKGSGYSESLRRQSRLFDAIENMSTKAAREVGTTRFSRFAKRHPLMTGLIKGAAKSAAIGATGGAGYELTNRILGE